MNANANINSRRNSLAARQAIEIGRYAAINGYTFTTYSAALATIQFLSRIAVDETTYQTDLVEHYAQQNAFVVTTRANIQTTIQTLLNITA
ncbi:MAG: hypothetical protein C0424_10385 [Sphingobacteriaceae bacterium]|nr:hypothetical protein [Sphingobacteriaceae bacterium]